MNNDLLKNLIGQTDLLKLDLDDGNTLFLKMENQNPSGSIKDRVFQKVIDYYEQAGRLFPPMRLTIASSGNAAISLAVLGAARGYHVSCYMPVTTSKERRTILTHLGAETYYVEGGMTAAQAEAQKAGTQKDSFFIDQFNDPHMLMAHDDTAAEIRDRLDHVDAFVTGVGSGVTLRALGSKLRNYYPQLEIIAFEPAEARALSHAEYKSHGLEGVGPNFPTPNFLAFMPDRILAVSKKEAYDQTLRLNQRGLLVGITTAAAIVAAAKAGLKNSTVVAVCYDGYDKYLEVLSQYEKEQKGEFH